MIKFHCSKCNKKIAVPDESVGKRCQCPKCKTISRVPDTSSSTEMSATDDSKQKDTVKISCPNCEKQYRIANKNLNKKMTCTECGSELYKNENKEGHSQANGNLVHFNCLMCKKELEAPEVMRGKTILCHHCQCNAEVPKRQSQASENEEQMPFKFKEQTNTTARFITKSR